MTQGNRITTFLVWGWTVLICLLLPVSVLAYGGGGGGGSAGEEGDLFGPKPASTGNTPSGGFKPTKNPRVDNVFVRPAAIDTSSSGSSDEQRDLEEQINEAAGELEQRQAQEERDRPMTRAEAWNRASEFLNTLPPEIRQHLIQRYSPTEILSIQWFRQMENAIRHQQNPEVRQVMQQSLTAAQNNFLRDVNIRRQEAQAQLQRTKEDFDKTVSFLAGVGVNIVTAGGGKIGYALNIGYNVATGGARGGLTAVAATVIQRNIPGGNVVLDGIRDQVTQEMVDAAIEPGKVY